MRCIRRVWYLKVTPLNTALQFATARALNGPDAQRAVVAARHELASGGTVRDRHHGAHVVLVDGEGTLQVPHIE